MRADYHEIYLRLANEYCVPIRLLSRRLMTTDGMGAILDQLDVFGVVTPIISCSAGRRRWVRLTLTGRISFALQPGVTEILCHPALARDELKSCARDALQREADLRYFTSEKARRLIADEGVALAGFRRLRDLMRGDRLARDELKTL